MTFGTDWLAHRSRRTPHAPALHARDETLSWAELAAEASRVAAWLHERGVSAGNTVATAVPVVRQLVPLVHAVASLGATLLPLHARLGPPELAPILEDARADALVYGAGPGVEAALAAAGRVPGMALLALPERLPQPSGGERPRARAPAHAQRRAPRALLFTSGTTGRAKGAELSHEAFYWSALASAVHLGVDLHRRWLACLPLYHVGGLAVLARSVLLGGSVIVRDRFDAHGVWRAIEALAPSGLSLVPTMLARVLDACGDRPPPGTLRGVLVGGAALPEPLLARAWRAGWPVLPTYGLTEACSQVATLRPHEIGRAGSGCGRPLPVTRVAITDPDGEPLAPGSEGEIRVRSATSMEGYRGQPGASARVLRGGWLRTGDIGVLDREGRLRVLDRRDDLIVSGGENVYPAEVEAALLAHPAVAEAAVAAESDAVLGQRVAAWIVVRPGARLDASELEAHCRKRLAGYKIPRALHVVDALPRTALGKVVRRALREGAVSPAARR